MKKFKGFTLIELIVAMAIFGILMTGIIQMVQPISENAAGAKIINEQKNVENAINTYIGENMRFATNLYIVKGGSPQNAVDKFIAAKPLDRYGNAITDKSKVDMICFDGTSQYTYSKYTPQYGGRIIRKIVGKTVTGNFDQTGCKSDGSGDYYMALGPDYYQQAEYFMTVDMSSKMLKLSVYSNFYKSATAKTSNPNAFSSSSGNPINGVYEMLSYGSMPMDGASNFVFKMIDFNGVEKTSVAVTPTDRAPIYFVFTTEDTLA